MSECARAAPAYPHGRLNPLAGRPQCHFLSQGRWLRLIEQNSPSCPSQITTKHLISTPTLSLPYFAPLLGINTLLLLLLGRGGGEKVIGKKEQRQIERWKKKRKETGGRKEGGQYERWVGRKEPLIQWREEKDEGRGVCFLFPSIPIIDSYIFIFCFKV